MNIIAQWVFALAVFIAWGVLMALALPWFIVAMSRYMDWVDEVISSRRKR